MKTITNKQLEKIFKFVNRNARKLDIELMRYFFNQSNSEHVLSELVKYQNKDGGFGYGLEPDFRTEVSSNIATTYAFQYLEKVKPFEIPQFMFKALDFFTKNYNKKTLNWIPIPKETNQSPHAIWWNYNQEKYLTDSEWGNPTVEIIGYLLRYKNNFDKNELNMLKHKSLKRLFDADEIEVHELMCYQRFVHSLNKTDKQRVYAKIASLALKQVERNVDKWKEYVSRPLYFVDNNKSPIYNVLKEEVDKELDYMIDNLDSEGGWYPNWEWGQYPEEWSYFKPEIAGMITVKNISILKQFERIL